MKYPEDFINKIIQGDCLEIMKGIPDKSIDLVLTDPPYGITSNEWDVVINFMGEALRVSSLVILTASQPFSSQMVVENLDHFKHEWIWIKNRGSNFANTVREPMKEHEQVLVFATEKWTYNKQMQERTGSGGDRVKHQFNHRSKSENYRDFKSREGVKLPNLRVPSSWQKFNTEVGKHPTQKPVELMSYLIKTYSNENNIILDPFLGSGTTAVAAKMLKRNFIGIEISPEYCKIAEKRLKVETLL